MQRRIKQAYRYKFTNDTYVALIVLHIVLGFLINKIPMFSALYFTAACSFFIFQIIVQPQARKSTWVFFGCAYIVAAESLFRMTGGGLFYEFSKYFVIFLLLIGMFYDGLSGKAYPYFIYLILLLPAVLVASINLGFDINFRTSVAFVLSGPVCLGVSALFCYDKKIDKEVLQQIIACLCFPIITMTTHLFLYNPNIKEIMTSAGSNFAASGGFGPNQVSTLLGLGMFAFTVRFFMKSPSLFLKIFNLVLLAAVSFRALITLSRGGVVGALIMIAAFLVVFYGTARFRQKQQIIVSVFLLILVAFITWTVSLNQSSGIVGNRYANEDAFGREKMDVSTGRIDLFIDEFEGFKEHPFLGVGASGMKQARLENMGRGIVSHNEISRLLSEHGIFGVVIILILILKPLDFRARNRSNVLFYAFMAFWFATINHSAMRIAAPGFIYGLSLLNVTNEKNTIHRKQIKQREN